MDAMGLGHRVRQEREAKEWSQAELARRVSLLVKRKISQVAIHHIEARDNVQPRFVVELAEALGVSLTWLQHGRGDKTISVLLHGHTDGPKKNVPYGTKAIDADITLPHRGEMPKDVPVRGTVSGGPGGFQMSNGEATDWVRRPPRLMGRTDVFALYVEDVSMVPAFKPGALIFVEKSRPPAPGDDVVIELHPEMEHGEQIALLKTYVGRTTTLLRVSQHNPAKVIEIPLKRLINLFRVMTMMDLLGV